MKNIKPTLIALAILITIFVGSKNTYAHCEIPCGIYTDSLRIVMMEEDIATIEKSMKKIIELSNEATPNYNQIVRWVMNKEEHAKKIQEIVSQYFLHQRVKVVDSSDKEHYDVYIKLLTTLHKISVCAMKTKQSVDLGSVEKLKASVEDLETLYFHSHKHK